VAFVHAVVSGLAEPPMERLVLERRILREEREQRGPSLGAAIRWYRFGYDGHGRGLGPGDDELGIDWLGAEPVLTWIAERYTRQNAVLWLSGPPPADLRLPLPDGRRYPVAAPTAVPGQVFPAHMRWEGPAATVGLIGPRTPAMNIVGGIAHRRMRQQLRFDHGLVYDVETEYQPLDADTAHVMYGAECPPERVGRVLAVLIDVLDELARNGPTPAELHAENRSFCRQFEERDGRLGLLDAVAEDKLWDGPVQTAQELLDARIAVDPGSAAAALDTALRTMLVLADADPPSGRFAEIPAWSAHRVDGREHGPAGFFLPGRKPKDRVRASSDGISVVFSPAEVMTARYRDCVASVHVTPSVRHLLTRDGVLLPLDADMWKDGQRLIDEIDASIPAALVACGEHGLGGLEDPDEAESAPSSAAG
jgi:zinc protease